MRYTYRVTQNNNYRNRSTQSDIRQGTTNRSYWVMTCETGLKMADLKFAVSITFWSFEPDTFVKSFKQVCSIKNCISRILWMSEFTRFEGQKNHAVLRTIFFVNQSIFFNLLTTSTVFQPKRLKLVKNKPQPADFKNCYSWQLFFKSFWTLLWHQQGLKSDNCGWI